MDDSYARRCCFVWRIFVKHNQRPKVMLVLLLVNIKRMVHAYQAGKSQSRIPRSR